jgi:cytidylate kinase
MAQAYIFGSYLHGSGRSFLADKLAEILKGRGLQVVRISSGDIFREIAKEHGKTIEEFIKMITEDENLARDTDVRVDSRIKDKIENAVNNNITPIVDSNLAPFYADGTKILVKVDPRIAGERVFKSKRDSDTNFQSPEDATKSLIERTKNDVDRYKVLSLDEKVPPYWREVYKRAANDWGDESVFDIIIDNSGSVENSIKQLLDKLGIK